MPTKEWGRHSKMAKWKTGKPPYQDFTILVYKTACDLPKRLINFIFDQALQVIFLIQS